MTQSPPTPPPLSDDPLLRDVPDIDGWKVLAPAVLYAKIGQGGMGAVYRGRHLELEIDVAVKCLKPSLVAEDEQFEARFRREARLAAELTHDNLIRLYELRRAHGLTYLILEFVEGETARDRVVRKGPLREEEAAMILLGAAKGLGRAHRHKSVVVHRDIKPENILVSKEGEVKLADLGLAKALASEQDVGLTTHGLVGTPAFMAPEQWDATKPIGPPTDIWAMGVTLYFLLTGKTPTRASQVPQVIFEICNLPFPDIRSLRPDISDGLLRILQRCTQRAPEDRYADAGMLARELEDFLGDRASSLLDRDSGKVKAIDKALSPPPEHALKRIRVASMGSSAPPTTPLPGSSAAKRQRGPRKNAFRYTTAAVAMLAVVALVFVFFYVHELFKPLLWLVLFVAILWSAATLGMRAWKRRKDRQFAFRYTTAAVAMLAVVALVLVFFFVHELFKPLLWLVLFVAILWSAATLGMRAWKRRKDRQFDETLTAKEGIEDRKRE